MNNRLQEELDARVSKLTEEDQKKLKTEVLQRLLDKLEQAENAEIEQDLAGLIQEIPYSPVNRATRKSLRVSLGRIQKKVKKVFGYVEKDSVKGSYVGVGMALGMAMGSGIGTGMGLTGGGTGIGMMMGLIIGISIGAAQEKKAEAEGLIY